MDTIKDEVLAIIQNSPSTAFEVACYLDYLNTRQASAHLYELVKEGRATIIGKSKTPGPGRPGNIFAATGNQ